MNKLSMDLEKEFNKLKGNVKIPEEINLLYEWIEGNGLVEAHDGLIQTLRGTIGDPTVHQYGRINVDYEFSPDITFSTSGQRWLHSWFNLQEMTDEISSRLVSFAESGMDGSQLAFWLDDDDELRIVHMGSGSGSMLCCIIANNAIDFLSLLSIGYSQLGDVYDFSLSPEEIDGEGRINHSFVEWLAKTFGIIRAPNAAGIIKKVSDIGDKNTSDPFCLWCNKQISL